MREIREFLIMLVACLAANPMLAQDMNSTKEKVEQAGDQMNISNTIAQVADGIKPEAFRGKFDMDEWKSKLSGVEATDISGMKESLRTLMDGLRNSSFTKHAKKDLYTQLIGINGKAGISEFLGSLVKGIEPDKLTDAFRANHQL